MAGTPEITVDLTKESLRLTICAACRALTRAEDFPVHQQWHAQHPIDATLIAHPERLQPSYCWKNWPPVHTDDCGCNKDGT